MKFHYFSQFSVRPRVLDNDPHFTLYPLNIPLAHPRDETLLNGDEQEILWQAEDRHGVTKKCGTKVEFVGESPKSLGMNPENGENTGIKIE
jgi:hypothetical protein